MGLMNDEAVKLAQRLSTAAAAGGVVDVWALLRDMTLNVIGLAAFGYADSCCRLLLVHRGVRQLAWQLAALLAPASSMKQTRSQPDPFC